VISVVSVATWRHNKNTILQHRESIKHYNSHIFIKNQKMKDSKLNVQYWHMVQLVHINCPSVWQVWHNDNYHGHETDANQWLPSTNTRCNETGVNYYPPVQDARLNQLARPSQSPEQLLSSIEFPWCLEFLCPCRKGILTMLFGWIHILSVYKFASSDVPVVRYCSPACCGLAVFLCTVYSRIYRINIIVSTYIKL
jgi:hypothetical protein